MHLMSILFIKYVEHKASNVMPERAKHSCRVIKMKIRGSEENQYSCLHQGSFSKQYFGNTHLEFSAGN